MALRIGIDVGGTFTDFLLMDEDGASRIHKVLSTPDDPSAAIINGLSEIADERGQGLARFFADVGMIVHGTTVTTNAVLTGKTAQHGTSHHARFPRCAGNAARHPRASLRQQVHRARSRWCRAHCGCRSLSA